MALVERAVVGGRASPRSHGSTDQHRIGQAPPEARFVRSDDQTALKKSEIKNSLKAFERFRPTIAPGPDQEHAPPQQRAMRFIRPPRRLDLRGPA